MPSLADRALLLELTTYLVSNNIRRGVLQVSANFQATDQESQETSKTVQPGVPWTFESLANNSVTVIRVTGAPLDVTTTIDGESVTFKIPSLMVFPDKLADIVFSNPSDSTRAALVQIIQV